MCDKPADAFAGVFLVGGPSWSYGGLDTGVGPRHCSASIGIDGLCDVLRPHLPFIL